MNERKPNLYEEMKQLERYQIEIRQVYGDHNQEVVRLNQVLSTYPRKLGTQLIQLAQVKVPEIDFRGIEIELFRKYSDNLVLCKAIKGDQTIEDRLTDLEENWKGFKRVIPRRKDPAYEQARQELAKLIPAEHLRKRGIFAWDNFVSPAIQVGIFSGCLYYLIDSIGLPPDFADFFKGMAFGLNIIPLASLPLCLTDGGGIVLWNESKQAAKYLDDKIKQLFQ